jgi:DNA-methyltransferase (dcm)
MVDQLRPKWFIWENVAGVLSSNGGRDFGSILGAMAELGYVFGWRVLDAQHFGVPQRRRRLFLVGCASGDIGDIGQVLFDAEGGQGDFGSGGETSEGFAGEVTGCTDRSSKRINTLDTQCGLEKLTHQSLKSGHYIVETFDQQRFDQWGTNKTASTVKARDYKDVTDMVVYENNPSDARLKPLGDKSSTVIARWGTGGNNVPLVHNKTIRRLTPVEVERLQGFPDNHTNIPWNRKEFAPDSRRYKAMGNSMAVPVMQWLGRRIQQVEESRA